MLSVERNELVTRTNAGTRGGDLMRRYWQPVALAEELRADTPLPVRILGEDLVLFRRADGTPALLGRRCPHRAVDLSYARVEEGGLRCIYHGWLLSGEGRCLDQPTEPSTSQAKNAIRHTAYPCFEGGGLVFTYMGPGTPPRIPKLPFLAAPPNHAWVAKGLIECNYLQGNEGNIDPQHLAYLHRFIDQSLSAQPDYNALLSRQTEPPKIDVEETPFGLRLFTSRAASPESKHMRVSNFIMPNCSSFDGYPLVDPKSGIETNNLGYMLHWHVPIDDETHWKYFIFYRYDGPVDVEHLRRFVVDRGDDALSRNARNRYLQDREEMKRSTFAGLGQNFPVHDKCAVEAQGRIMDRSTEHLSSSDRPVAMMRLQLLQAIDDVQAGRDPRLVERDGQDDALSDMGTIVSIIPTDTDVLNGWWHDRNRELRAKADYLSSSQPSARQPAAVE